MSSSTTSDFFWDQEFSLLSVAAKSCYWATTSSAEKQIARSVLDLGRKGTIASVETWRDSAFLTLSTFQAHLVKCTIPACDIVDSKTGETVLHAAMENASLSSELIKAVHSLGIDVDARDLCGRTPLHTLVLNRGSSSKHLLEFVKTLIDLGASVLATDAAGNSVFQMFPRGGSQYPDIVKDTFLYLLEVRREHEKRFGAPFDTAEISFSPESKGITAHPDIPLGTDVCESTTAIGQKTVHDSVSESVDVLTDSLKGMEIDTKSMDSSDRVGVDKRDKIVTDLSGTATELHPSSMDQDNTQTLAKGILPQTELPPDTPRSFGNLSSASSQSTVSLELRRGLVKRSFVRDVHTIRSSSPAYFSILLVDKRTPCDPGFFHTTPLVGEGVDIPHIANNGYGLPVNAHCSRGFRYGEDNSPGPLAFDAADSSSYRSDLKVVSRGVFLKEGDPNNNIACIRMSEAPESGYAPALAIGPFRGQDAEIQSRIFTDLWRDSIRRSFVERKCDAECDWLTQVDFAEALTRSVLSFYSAIQVLSLVDKAPVPVLTKQDEEHIRSVAQGIRFDRTEGDFSSQVRTRLEEFIHAFVNSSMSHESPLPQGHVTLTEALKRYLSTQGTKLSDGLLSRLRCPHRDGTGYCEFSAVFWARAIARNSMVSYNYQSDSAANDPEEDHGSDSERETGTQSREDSPSTRYKVLAHTLKERHRRYGPSLERIKAQLEGITSSWTVNRLDKDNTMTEMLENRLIPYLQRPSDKHKAFNLVHSHYNKYHRHDYPLYPITLTANKQADDGCARIVDMSVAEGLEDITTQDYKSSDGTSQPEVSDAVSDQSSVGSASVSGRHVTIPTELERGRAGAMGYYIRLGTPRDLESFPLT